MFRLYQRIALQCLQAEVTGHPVAMVVNLHSIFGNPDIGFFPDQTVRHGIFVPSVGNQVVIWNLCHSSDCSLKWRRRQRQHISFFFIQIRVAASAGALLKLAGIQLFQLFGSSCIDFMQRKELVELLS